MADVLHVTHPELSVRSVYVAHAARVVQEVALTFAERLWVVKVLPGPVEALRVAGDVARVLKDVPGGAREVHEDELEGERHG